MLFRTLDESANIPKAYDGTQNCLTSLQKNNSFLKKNAFVQNPLRAQSSLERYLDL